MPTPINWPGATYGSGTGTQYTSPNGNIWIWNGYAWEGLVNDVTSTIGALYTKELISGGAVWNSGLTFDVSILTYTFYGPLQTTSSTTQVTLNTGDPTFDRIDAIVVSDDDPNGIVSVIEGTPGANPITPEIPSDQLLVQYVIVPTGAVSLSINQEIIYDQNTEWTSSTITAGGGVGTFDFDATSPTPYLGSKCLSVTGNNKRKWARFTKSGSVNAVDYSSISFYVQFPSTLPTNRRLSIRFRNASGYIGSTVFVNPPFASGTSTSTWQMVVIPLYLFGIGGSLTAVEFQLTGGLSSDLRSWAIDYVQLQGGFSPTYGTSNSQNKPWAIYSQGTGVPSYYNTFTQALSSAINGDTIQLLAKVNETLGSTIAINLPRLDINLNGHTWTLSNQTATIGNCIELKAACRELNFYNGKIETSGIITGSSGALIEQQASLSIRFNGVVLANNTLGYAYYADSVFVNLEGGIFTSNNTNALYLRTVSDGSTVNNAITYTTGVGPNIASLFMSIGAGSGYLTDSKGYVINSSSENSSGIYFSGGGSISNCYGFNNGATATAGIYVRGKCTAFQSTAIHSRSSSDVSPIYGMVAEASAGIDSCSVSCAKGYAIYSTESSPITNTSASGLLAFYSTINTNVRGCTLEGSVAIFQESPTRNHRVQNSTLIGGIVGATDGRWTIRECSFTGSDSGSTVDLGPSGGAYPIDENIIVNNSFVGGATGFAITASGPSARGAYMANNTFQNYPGPTGWDPVKIIQLITTSEDSQGNISF